MIKYLFTPLKIGPLELKNRLVVPAMATKYCNPDGTVNERFICYHEAKARGGWGLIITENYTVSPHGGAFVNLPGLWRDEQMPGHRLLVQRVHAAGAKICCQVYHAGRATHPKNAENGVCVAPSAMKDYTRRDLPRALTTNEIHHLVKEFGDAAARAKAVGFDMVELHGAHGYLITQFLSPLSNRRSDEYGGNLWNRARFLLEIIEEVKARVGKEFPIQLRISSLEYLEGGISLADSMAIARLAEEAGVGSIHVSQGHQASAWRVISPYYVPHGAYQDHAAAIKSAVSVPVIGVGRITDPLTADSLIAANCMDAVAMGRASLADPELPNKAREGKFDSINYCIGCLQGCAGKAVKNGIGCFVNPQLGHEYEDLTVSSTYKKRIFVAGGGIAGCEAAIMAARKGHRVSLFEREAVLGGQWRAAIVPSGKAEFVSLMRRQARQLKELSVDVRTETELTGEILKAECPDLLFIATGGIPARPPIPGIDADHVATAGDVLLGKAPLGKNVVIVGGGLVGCETTEYAAEQKANVTLVEMLPALAKDGEPGANHFLFQNLERANVRIYLNARCKQIEEDRVTVEVDGAPIHIEKIDQVILAAGTKAYDPLSSLADELGIAHIAVGDAAGAKNGLSNLWEAYTAAAELK